ncbi:hypothetical protein CTM62_04030 [Prevotella intermedia]|uniref:Uncharacterized protein n=1 Tax=Prevotella intermedia TaxID=28131 RepID=A0A2D3L687_PREIN|nr:hypothetical protein CTM62_04030 [Prevotella intermedia]
MFCHILNACLVKCYTSSNEDKIFIIFEILQVNAKWGGQPLAGLPNTEIGQPHLYFIFFLKKYLPLSKKKI